MSESMRQVIFTLSLLLVIKLVHGNLECITTITVNTYGNDTEDCLEGDYPCSSLGYVLNHLQSNDCVNITSNSVPLTTIVELHNLNAITIRGQGNTIVMCNNTGGVSCNNCSNVVIEEITWDGCGDPGEKLISGGIDFNGIENLSVNNCILQFSKVRALSLRKVSGIVKIANTRIMFNANYEMIYCNPAQAKPCTTSTFAVTGGIVINESINATEIDISNCLFESNGYFGPVNDTKYVELPSDAREIANGAALLLMTNNRNVSVNISISDSRFSSNRGNNGGAVRIITHSSPVVKLNRLVFHNNSVVRWFVTASALMLYFNVNSSNVNLPLLQMSSCTFQDNCHGRSRNMISYFVAGISSYVAIKNCTFINNSKHGFALLEININSQALVNISDSHFSNNGRSTLVYLHIHFSNITAILYNLQMINNSGYANSKKGGLIFIDASEDNCSLTIANLSFLSNRYFSNGGGVYIFGTYQSSFKAFIKDSLFTGNFGYGSGTVLHSSLTCDIEKAYMIVIDNCIFRKNHGKSIMYVSMGNFVIPAFLVLSATFYGNIGTPLETSNVMVAGNGATTFLKNQADTAAGMHLSDSYILLNYTSFHFDFMDNFANLHGGALYVDFALSNTDHSQCHWLFYSHNTFCSNFTHRTNNCSTFIDTSLFCKVIAQKELSISSVYMINNTALSSGSAIFYSDAYNFQMMSRSSNVSDPMSIFYIPDNFTLVPNATVPLVLSTQPQKLRLSNPANCNDDDTFCNVIGVTLGQEIKIPACIVGYNNKSAETTRFFVKCIQNCVDFTLMGDSFVLVNDKFSGISISGNEVIQNNSVSLRLYSGQINVTLIVHVVPCHMGYAYNKFTKTCQCYDVDNVISCSANKTTIKKTYWFGTVVGQTTVSRCPNGFCNFSRIDVSHGKFLLTPFRNDQCSKHRTGPACSKCIKDYTLSFEFDDCISTDDCTYGMTVLVIVCSLLFWIAVIALALGLMYFQINVGYLYGIIYYYSMIAVLLGQIWNYSDELDIINKVLSSFIRLNPGFLGNLCFVEGMSGIDQYVLFYIHPTAVLLILLLLAFIARKSRRFAAFLSRGIIHVICLILTLTYTAIAETSLQLLRQIKFTGIDDVYCYLSPHIEYFTGRHIAYSIIAVLYELVIVAGLPLLLLIEPFINNRINFTKIKPLLDQLQGFYKDKYRWFASIYLLCRQAILVIMVIDYSDPFIPLCLLLVACLIVALFHYLLQPYKSDLLNRFDGFILQLLVLLVALQMVVLSESTAFTNNVIIGITYGLIFSPILVYFSSLLFLKRRAIQHAVLYVCSMLQVGKFLPLPRHEDLATTFQVPENRPLLHARRQKIPGHTGLVNSSYNHLREPLELLSSAD
ncbi:uncharacterized protein [Dysidea avara]|uniref:uncharacterized protein isoform X2 n=1 Tax=Dysidea avara TaxID=196820 RepID=UPI00332673D3